MTIGSFPSPSELFDDKGSYLPLKFFLKTLYDKCLITSVIKMREKPGRP
jgi:hypothetical protein